MARRQAASEETREEMIVTTGDETTAAPPEEDPQFLDLGFTDDMFEEAKFPEGTPINGYVSQLRYGRGTKEGSAFFGKPYATYSVTVRNDQVDDALLALAGAEISKFCNMEKYKNRDFLQFTQAVFGFPRSQPFLIDTEVVPGSGQTVKYTPVIFEVKYRQGQDGQPEANISKIRRDDTVQR